MILRPPTNPGSSIAAAAARIGAGKAGIYRKVLFKEIWKNQSNFPVVDLPSLTGKTDAAGTAIATRLSAAGFAGITNAAFFNFETTNPSARIRHAFGVSALSPTADYSNADVDGYIPQNGYGYVNVFPGVQVKGAMSGSVTTINLGASDQSSIMWGQAIYPTYAYITTPGQGGANAELQAFHPGGLHVGGYDGTAGNSGGTPTPNGVAFPFTHEAVTIADRFRCVGGVLGTAGQQTIAPLYAWAVWEIYDPRDEADSEALLAECLLNVDTQRL